MCSVANDSEAPIRKVLLHPRKSELLPNLNQEKFSVHLKSLPKPKPVGILRKAEKEFSTVFMAYHFFVYAFPSLTVKFNLVATKM